MNNEIKGILDVVKLEINSTKSWIKPLGLNRDAWNKLLDYITNLQEENRQTKLLKERYQLEKEDYKSRIDKAIKYIKEKTKNICFENDRLIEVYQILNKGE